MKKNVLLLLIMISISIYHIQAQTLFTYGGYNVDKKEFVKFYEENNFDKNKYSVESVNNYINMYALYKMKIKEAEVLKIDTISKVNSEIENLKKQLSKTYLVDNNVIETLLKEIEKRYSTEIEIAHIQITTWGNDTTDAYQQIHNIYNDIKDKKTSFEDAVVKYSDDGYSKGHQGYLGYISALDIKYGIENAAYSTAVGQISQPFKSELGYHIVKVIGKREARGQLHIAQILIKPENSSDQKSVQEAKELSEKLLKELRAGADFNGYVKKYSSDLLTKDNNGVIPPFNPGTYQLPFEKAAFNIDKAGAYGEIVHSEFGFHIIRFISRENKPSFESVKSQYTQRLKQDGRIKIAESAVKNDQLKKMNFKEVSANYEAIINWAVQDTSKVMDLKTKDKKNFNAVLFSLKGYNFTQSDFIDYMIDVTGGQIYGKKDESISQLYEMYKSNTLDNVHLDELYKNNSAYREAFDRDRNGVMIFELMNQRIWLKSNEDIDGMLQFYESNKSKYTYRAGFEGYILESQSQDALRKVVPLLTNYESIPEILFDFNQTSPVRVDHIKGKYEFQQMPNLKTDNIPVRQPSAMFMTPNEKASVIIADKTFPEGTVKSFSEARSAVVNDYQLYLDEQWSQELLNKYPVTINKKTADSIIKK